MVQKLSLLELQEIKHVDVQNTIYGRTECCST